MYKNGLRKKLQTVLAVRGWTRNPLPYVDPQEHIKGLLQTRDKRFLALMREAVYDYSQSPYLKLLHHVGCTYADLEAQVEHHGLETTLNNLVNQGVYVTHDEMKGRTPAQRGSATFHFSPSEFDNPLITPQLNHTTSGSTGKATIVGVTFQHFQQQLLHTALSVTFHGVTNASLALWLPPSEWSISRIMRLTKLGITPKRWFSQIPVFASRSRFMRGISMASLVAVARMNGMALPMPRYVSLSESHKVLDWMLAVIRQDQRPFLITYPSTASRLCSLAVQEGISLSKALVLVAGESVTAAKRSVIEATGAVCLPLFGATETGESAEGCLRPLNADDMHLYMHKFALVAQQRSMGQHQDFNALFFTTLDTATPKLFLNADMGDTGIVEQRDCDCPWGRLGFTTHLHNIWSYAKLTLEGMTLMGDDVYSVLEKVMPQRCGGQAGDYQLLAESDNQGLTHYLLAVNPAVGPMDEERVRKVFLNALVHSKASSRLTSDFLHLADQCRVIRRAPFVQSGGKCLPVVLSRSPKEK